MNAAVDQSVFLELRRQGIGASEAAAAVGLSKWQTPVDLYLQKVGEVDPDYDAEALHLAMGKALEPLVLERFTKKTGIAARSHQERVVDPAWSHRWVTVDAIADDGGLVEAKTTAIAMPGEWGDELTDDAVPMQYYLQAQHGMACTGRPHVWMPLLVLNRQFRLYRIVRDDDVIYGLTEKQKTFWACVEARQPPDPITLDDVSALWPQDSGAELVATAEIATTVAELKTAKAELKALEERVDTMSLALKVFLGERAILLPLHGGKPLATWKTAKPSRVFDKDAFRDAHPSLYTQFEIERPGSRRLLLK